MGRGRERKGHRERERERESTAAIFAQSFLAIPTVLLSLLSPRSCRLCCPRGPTMRPTPSLITQLANGAQVWASGTFNEMDAWVGDNSIELLVNLLGHRVCRRCDWEEWDMTEYFTDWEERLQEVIEAMTVALYSGKHVLVHCAHGLQHTGSLITFWMALGLVSQEGVSGPDAWLEKLSEAWQTWSRGRQLRQATADDRHGRNYEDESWRAVFEYFGDMRVDLVREMAEGWGRIAQAAGRNIHKSQGSQRSEQSVLSRLPLQTATAWAQASSSAASSSAASSSAAPPASSAASSSAAPPPAPPVAEPSRGQKRSSRAVARAEPMPFMVPQPPWYPPSSRVRTQHRHGPDWIPGQEWQHGDWICDHCGNHNWRRNGFCKRHMCRAPRDRDFRMGVDWYCRCGNFNKGHRQVCNRSICHEPRQGNEQLP